jgi:hypothetical protein
MSLDLNFRRRREEKEIAAEVARRLLELSAARASDPNAIGARVVAAFNQLGLTPDSRSTGRILRYANAELERLRRGLEAATDGAQQWTR